MMDKMWIHESNRLSIRYLQGVVDFIEFARKSSKDGKLACPYIQCVNGNYYSEDIVINHILKDVFSSSYSQWYFHDEPLMSPREGTHSNNLRSTHIEFRYNVHVGFSRIHRRYDNCHSNIGKRGFANDLAEHHNFSDVQNENHNNKPNKEAQKFYELLMQNDDEIFEGNKKHSKLSFILDLFHKKCMYGWSNQSFKDLLGTLREKISEGEKSPKSSYEVKNLIGELGLGYEKIHACPNNCLLFCKDKVNDQVCLKCGASRWETDIKDFGIGSSTSMRKKEKEGEKCTKMVSPKAKTSKIIYVFQNSLFDEMAF